MMIKMAVFWVVAPLVWQKFTNVSQVPAASIVRVVTMVAASACETPSFRLQSCFRQAL
jgi:hypothetical protein